VREAARRGPDNSLWPCLKSLKIDAIVATISEDDQLYLVTPIATDLETFNRRRRWRRGKIVR